MKIADVEAYMLTGPPEEREHWVSHYPVHQANELLVRVKTDEGLEGFGPRQQPPPHPGCGGDVQRRA